MSATSIRVTRKVGAAAAVVFDLLANPDRHHEIDPSGMVGDDVDASPITKIGQVFRMNMTSSNNGAAVTYQVDNHVTEFEPNRRIAWEVGLVDGERLGRTWTYVLEPRGDGKSSVALTYDWSGVTPEACSEYDVPTFDHAQLAASLDLLESALSRSASRDPAALTRVRAGSARRKDPDPSVRRRRG